MWAKSLTNPVYGRVDQFDRPRRCMDVGRPTLSLRSTVFETQDSHNKEATLVKPAQLSDEIHILLRPRTLVTIKHFPVFDSTLKHYLSGELQFGQ